MYRLVVEDGGTGFKIQGYDGSFQTRLIIDSTGKIGIGTTSPGTLLHLSAANPVLRFQDSDGTNQLTEISNAGGHTYIKSRNNTSGGNLYINTWDNGNSNYPTLFTILNSGNVGIGTTGPTETLHVYQSAVDNVNVLLEQGNTNSGNLIQFKQTTTGSVTRTAYIGHGGDATGQLMIQNSGNIYLQTGGSNTALTIDATQNSTFEGWVQLKDSKALYIGTSNDLSLFHDATDCRIRYNHAVGDLKFQINDNSDVMTLKADKKVGIGTTAPASVLEVQGAQGYADSASTLATSTSKSALRVRGSNNSSDSLWMGVETSDANPYIQGSNGVGNNAKKLLLNPFGGNVGIGTTAPSYTLNLQGADATGGFYAHGRNHYLSNRSDAYASLTIKKSNADSDAIDYLQIRDSGNNLKSHITGAGNWKPIAGGGIDFSAAGNAGGMTSELLDDYEEGNFTVSFWASNTNFNTHPTLTTNTGRYTKVGNKVSISGRVIWSNNAGGAAGNIYMSGLPFNDSGNSIYSGVHFAWWSLDSAALQSDETLGGYVNNGQSYIVFVASHINSSAVSSTISADELMNGKSGDLQFNCTYFTT
jgi:hypothetical protein